MTMIILWRRIKPLNTTGSSNSKPGRKQKIQPDLLNFSPNLFSYSFFSPNLEFLWFDQMLFFHKPTPLPVSGDLGQAVWGWENGGGAAGIPDCSFAFTSQLASRERKGYNCWSLMATRRAFVWGSLGKGSHVPPFLPRTLVRDSRTTRCIQY